MASWDDDHRDRENERGQAHHRGDGREDESGGIRTADDAGGKRLVVEVAVNRDGPKREPPRLVRRALARPRGSI